MKRTIKNDRIEMVFSFSPIFFFLSFLFSKGSYLEVSCEGKRMTKNWVKSPTQLLEIVAGWEKVLASMPEGKTIVSSLRLDACNLNGEFFHSDYKTGTWYECVPEQNFPRDPEDGRCCHCEGWGCCACGHTGGY